MQHPHYFKKNGDLKENNHFKKTFLIGFMGQLISEEYLILAPITVAAQSKA
jgi:hypothetical protein